MSRREAHKPVLSGIPESYTLIDTLDDFEPYMSIDSPATPEVSPREGRPRIRILGVRFEPRGRQPRVGLQTLSRFLAEVHFELIEGDGEPASQEVIPCVAQIHAIDVDRRVPSLLGSTSERLLPGLPEYVIRVGFDLPPSGCWRLQTVVFVLGENAGIDLLKGPFVRVLP